MDKRSFGRMRWWTGPVGLLVAIVGIQSICISGLSSLIPAYLHRSGAGDFLVGMSFTTWAITRGAFGLVAGRMYGRLGARRLLAGSLGLFALTTLGYALDHAPLVLVGLRLGQGVAAGLFWTALLAATAQASPPSGRLRTLSYVNMVYAATGLASNLLAGTVAAALSPAAWFWLECGVLALIGVPLALTLRVADDARAPGHAEAAAAATTAPRPQSPPALGARQRLQAGLAAMAGLPVVVTAVGAPVLLSRAGAGYRVVGLVVAGMVLANIAAQAPASRLAARWGEGRLLAALGGAAALLLAALPFVHGAAALSALVIPLSGVLSLIGLTWLSWAQAGVPPGALGALTGLMRGIGDLSAVLAYTAFGLIAAHFGPSLWILAAIAAGTGLGALRLGARADDAGRRGPHVEEAEALAQAAD